MNGRFYRALMHGLRILVLGAAIACTLEPASTSSSHRGTPADEGAMGEAIALSPLPVGTHRLRILSSQVLELFLITTRRPAEQLAHWDFVREGFTARLPSTSEFVVTANGRRLDVTAVGFKRRVLYAPLAVPDVRTGNWLYLKLAEAIPEEATVVVDNPSGA
ncbi:MAG: hypothetical protein D6723_11945, partial [Acidobacteria bacterium]